MVCLIFCKHPWSRLVDVFVAAAEQVKYSGDRICHTEFVHFLLYFISGSGNDSL